MKIELRNIKYAAFASEETSCFEATIYVDGIKAGRASNQGHGGPTDIDPHQLSERLDAYGATLPQVDLGEELGDRRMMTQDGEWIVDQLLGAWLTERDLKRVLGRKILYVNDGKVFETKSYPKSKLGQLLAEPVKVRTALKSEQVLNLMPFAEALEIYKGIGA